MPNVPYPYEVNGKLVTGNGSLIPIRSLSNRSLLPSLTVLVYSKGACANFGQNAHVCVRLEFWQNAHVRAMCVRPKIECANVRACEAKIRRNSQFGLIYSNIT
jgi:hypothetical protein